MDAYIATVSGPQEEVHVQRCHSFVTNMARQILCGLADVNGVPRSVNGVTAITMAGFRNTSRCLFPGVGILSNLPASDCGLLPGSSAAAFDIEAYNYSTQIANGSSSGQLSYDNTVCPGITISGDGTYAYIDVSRVFTNYGAADVTINEIFLVGRDWQTNSYWYRALYGRDVLDAPITLQTGKSANIILRLMISL